jgi:hypothetical protein
MAGAGLGLVVVGATAGGVVLRGGPVCVGATRLTGGGEVPPVGGGAGELPPFGAGSGEVPPVGAASGRGVVPA